jgi:hypothetical protein
LILFKSLIHSLFLLFVVAVVVVFFVQPISRLAMVLIDCGYLDVIGFRLKLIYRLLINYISKRRRRRRRRKFVLKF